ncbi:MAG: TonB family protein [Desulfobacteraceae bacterium]|nr:TonB family protein [Desulfobacteraceae bacterium]
MSTILISKNSDATFTGPGHDDKSSKRRFFVAFASLQGVSILLHIALVLLMILTQQHVKSNKKLPPSLQVDLVSYSPKLEDLLKSETKPTKKEATKKPVVRVKPKPKKKSVTKKIEPISIKKEESVKEKKPSQAEMIEAAKKDIKEKVEEQEDNKIKDILSELRDKVIEKEMEDDYEEEEIPQTGFKGWGKSNVAESVYNSLLMASVQDNYVITARLAQLGRKNKDINVLVMIKILSNGNLGDIWIETKSGNDFLDKSALRAIKKAAPFPPLPKEFQRSSYEIGLLFSPKGLN